MNASAVSMKALVEKIRSLPEERIAEVDDFVDFLRARSGLLQHLETHDMLDFPVDHVGTWPVGLTLRRGEMYGDDGR